MKTSLVKTPVEIKIATVMAVSVILHSTDLSELNVTLAKMTGGVSDFFDNEFAVIDVSQVEESVANLDWPMFLRLLKAHHLNPVAVRYAPPEIHTMLIALGLTIDNVSLPKKDIVQEEIERVSRLEEVEAIASTTPPILEKPTGSSTMIVDTPVRGGQRIYAQGDLIITAAVNHGAEVIADGSIHVYAPLRGRALAGARGNVEARIFAMAMEPELVSIAGMYRTFENGFPKEFRKHPSQVRLNGNKIDIVAFTVK